MLRIYVFFVTFKIVYISNYDICYNTSNSIKYQIGDEMGKNTKYEKYDEMSIEELESEITRINQEIEDIKSSKKDYHFSVHEENGLNGIENEEKINKLKNRKNAIKRRIDKKNKEIENVKEGENVMENTKVEELKEKIEKWQEELETVWAGKETDAAEVERRNLRNLISNAKKEIEEIENPKKQTELGNSFDALKKEYEDIKKKDADKKLQINRLKNRIDKLTDERENYASLKNTSYKDIYDEYTKQIEETEKEIKELEKEPQAEKDKKLRAITALRMEYEKQIKEKQKEIRAVQREIEDIEFGTEEAMVEKELSDGTKVKTPKILDLYKKKDELEKALKELETNKKECQAYIDQIKGIEEREEPRELTAEEIKYFHGQGDVVENTRDDRRANDEYFGFEKVKPGMKKDIGGTPKPNPTIPEPDPIIPFPPNPTPTPTPEKINEKNLPIRTFSQILAETKTEHISKAEYLIYKMSKMNLHPFKRASYENSAEKVLGAFADIVFWGPKAIAKGVSKIPNLFLDTNEKIDILRDNIEKMSPEDFAILTQTKKELNQDGEKQKNEFDEEQLDSNTIKERKINQAYLELVGDRLHAENEQKMQQNNDRIVYISKKIEQIKKDMSEEKDLVKISEMEDKLVELHKEKRTLRETNKEIREKDHAYASGVEHKTGAFKDIKGWIFAKRDPNNTELDKKYAEIDEKRAIAELNGELKKVELFGIEKDNIMMDNTSHIGGKLNENNAISNGHNDIEKYGQIGFVGKKDTTTKKIIIAIAIGTAMHRIVTYAKDVANMQELNEANENIEANTGDLSEKYRSNLDEAQEQFDGARATSGQLAREYDHANSGTFGQDISEHEAWAEGAKGGFDTVEGNNLWNQVLKIEKKWLQDSGDKWNHFGTRTSIDQVGDGEALVRLEEILKKGVDITVHGKMGKIPNLDSSPYALALIAGRGIIKDMQDRREAKRAIKKARKENKEHDNEEKNQENNTKDNEEDKENTPEEK